MKLPAIHAITLFMYEDIHAFIQTLAHLFTHIAYFSLVKKAINRKKWLNHNHENYFKRWVLI